jgi:hypothetical protein
VSGPSDNGRTPIAAGILYPFLGILLSPIIAAAAMSLISVSVIGNPLQLRAYKPVKPGGALSHGRVEIMFAQCYAAFRALLLT